MTIALAVVKLKYGLDINNSSRILELIISYAQVSLIVALTRAGGRSVISTFLRSWPMQQLGQLSFSVYLIHFVVIAYIQFFLGTYVLPLYGLILVPAITIPLAYLMFYFVEETVRIHFK
jgi:peptidoglycan/LPS O-acetylase OafA/YrhL